MKLIILYIKTFAVAMQSSHRDQCTHIERVRQRQNTAWLCCIMDLQGFHSFYIKVLYCVHLKLSSFGPSADAKPMSNDLVFAMLGQCMFVLYMYYVQSLWVKLVTEVSMDLHLWIELRTQNITVAWAKFALFIIIICYLHHFVLFELCLHWQRF